MRVLLSDEQATEVEGAIVEQIVSIDGWLVPEPEKARARLVLERALLRFAAARRRCPCHEKPST